MRFNAAVAAAVLAFAGPSFAQEADADAESSPSIVAERPSFTVSSRILHQGLNIKTQR